MTGPDFASGVPATAPVLNNDVATLDQGRRVVIDAWGNDLNDAAPLALGSLRIVEQPFGDGVTFDPTAGLFV